MGIITQFGGGSFYSKYCCVFLLFHIDLWTLQWFLTFLFLYSVAHIKIMVVYVWWALLLARWFC